jgi:hypothetical protein
MSQSKGRGGSSRDCVFVMPGKQYQQSRADDHVYLKPVLTDCFIIGLGGDWGRFCILYNAYVE